MSTVILKLALLALHSEKIQDYAFSVILLAVLNSRMYDAHPLENMLQCKVIYLREKNRRDIFLEPKIISASKNANIYFAKFIKPETAGDCTEKNMCNKLNPKLYVNQFAFIILF